MATDAALERQFTRPDTDRPQGPDDGSAASILFRIRQAEVLAPIPNLNPSDPTGQDISQATKITQSSSANSQTPAQEQPDVVEVFMTLESIVEDGPELPTGPILSATKPPVAYRNPHTEQGVRELPHNHDFEWPANRDVRAEMIKYTRTTIEGDLKEYSDRYQEAYAQAQNIILTMITNNAPFNLLAPWKETIAQARAMVLGGLNLSGGLVKGEGNHTEPFVDRDIALEYAGAHTQFEDFQEKLDELQRSTTRIVEDYVRDHPSSRLLFGAHPEKTLRANPAHLRGSVDPERAISPLSLVSNAAPHSTDNPRQITLYRNWHGENNLPEQPRKPQPSFLRRGQGRNVLANLAYYLTHSKDPTHLDS